MTIILHPECDEDLLDLLKVKPVKQKIYKQKKFSFSRSIQVNKLNSLLVMAALVEYQAKARPNVDPSHAQWRHYYIAVLKNKNR